MMYDCPDCGKPALEIIGATDETTEIVCHNCGRTEPVGPDDLGMGGLEWIEGQIANRIKGGLEVGNPRTTGEPPTRRDFLKTSAGAAAALGALGRTRSAHANDRLSIGLIGCGSRMRGSLMPLLNNYRESHNAEVTAVCDPWRQAREEAAAMCEDWYGRAPRQYVSYRDLIEDGDLDAVMIASCDHQHTTHLKAAAEANLDAYCEKPLAKDFDGLKAAYDAVREHGVIVQNGTQVRSFASVEGAVAFFQTGALGKISRIQQCRNGARPYWYNYIRDVDEDDVDWAEFLMDRPMRPFDPVVYSGWYGYREFSDGPTPGYGSHFIDLAHRITGAAFPASCVAMSGVCVWDDEHGFDAPDHANVVWEYPEGFQVYYTTNFGNSSRRDFTIFGDKGIMDLTDWNNIHVSGEGAYGSTDLPSEPVRVDDVERPGHIEDWLDCIRSREEPNAGIEAGYQHAVACLMAMRASDTGRRQIYDPAAREIREG